MPRTVPRNPIDGIAQAIQLTMPSPETETVMYKAYLGLGTTALGDAAASPVIGRYQQYWMRL